MQALDRAALEREFEANSAFFATLDPRVSLDNFAYPYGSVGLRQKRAMQERFLSCRSVREGIVRACMGLLELSDDPRRPRGTGVSVLPRDPGISRLRSGI